MPEFYPIFKAVGKNIKFRIGTTDESYTENITILPPNAYVTGIYGRVTTAFAGLTKPKVSVGVTGDTARYMVAQPIDVANDLISGKLLKSSDGIRKSSAFYPDKYKRDLPRSMGFCEAMKMEKTKNDYLAIIATFTSSSTDFSGCTAGEVEFIVTYIDPNR